VDSLGSHQPVAWQIGPLTLATPRGMAESCNCDRLRQSAVDGDAWDA
jgi:hypothetical protein